METSEEARAPLEQILSVCISFLGSLVQDTWYLSERGHLESQISYNLFTAEWGDGKKVGQDLVLKNENNTNITHFYLTKVWIE